MFIAGYVYNTNPSRPGFRPQPPVDTEAEAQKWIEEQLAGKVVTYQDSGRDGKFRAFADGGSTNYIYFEVKTAEKWALIDTYTLGHKGKSAVKGTGPLAGMKDKARKILDKHLKSQSLSLKTINFDKTRDNIEVCYSTEGSFNRDSGLVIVRV